MLTAAEVAKRCKIECSLMKTQQYLNYVARQMASETSIDARDTFGFMLNDALDEVNNVYRLVFDLPATEFQRESIDSLCERALSLGKTTPLVSSLESP